MNRPTASDPGLAVINNVYDGMGIDDEWAEWNDRGFSWWGCQNRQRVWVEEGVDDDGFTIYRLHARTDLCTGFCDTDEQLNFLLVTAPLMTLSGFARDPENPTMLQLATSVYVHEGNYEWARILFNMAVGMQVAEAATISGNMAAEFGMGPAASEHPVSGSREDLDDMLNIFELLPMGEQSSAYAGEELESTTNLLDNGGSVFTNGDANGVTAEFPHPDLTWLLQIRADEEHTRAGNGLLSLLTMPDGQADLVNARHALELNELELESFTRTAFAGTWCAAKNGLTFVSFSPNCLYRKGCIQNIVMAQIIRGVWISKEILDYSWEEHYESCLERKNEQLEKLMKLFGDDHSESQSSGASGFFKRLFGK